MKTPKLDFNIIQHIKKLCIAALFIGAAILFFACENDIQQIKAFSTPENLPIVEAYNFETLFTDSGVVRFSLVTPKLLRFENEGIEYIEFPLGMKLVKYDANRKVVSSITSEYAKQFVKEQKWEAKNNVIATNEVGDTLKTEYLIWEEKTEKIYTEEFVKIIRSDQIITGIGFTSDQEMVNWRIKKPKGVVYVTVNDQNNKSGNEVKPDSKVKDNKANPINGPIQFRK